MKGKQLWCATTVLLFHQASSVPLISLALKTFEQRQAIRSRDMHETPCSQLASIAPLDPVRHRAAARAVFRLREMSFDETSPSRITLRTVFCEPASLPRPFIIDTQHFSIAHRTGSCLWQPKAESIAPAPPRLMVPLLLPITHASLLLLEWQESLQDAWSWPFPRFFCSLLQYTY